MDYAFAIQLSVIEQQASSLLNISTSHVDQASIGRAVVPLADPPMRKALLPVQESLVAALTPALETCFDGLLDLASLAS